MALWALAGERKSVTPERLRELREWGSLFPTVPQRKAVDELCNDIERLTRLNKRIVIEGDELEEVTKLRAELAAKQERIDVLVKADAEMQRQLEGEDSAAQQQQLITLKTPHTCFDCVHSSGELRYGLSCNNDKTIVQQISDHHKSWLCGHWKPKDGLTCHGVPGVDVCSCCGVANGHMDWCAINEEKKK